MTSKREIVGVVCHDAGGAEIVSSYISLNNITVKYCLSGPAIKVFKRKFGSIKNNLLIDMIDNVDWLLCGTSWQSNLEWNTIQEAKKHDKKVVSFLEHWANYPERFNRNGVTVLPDEIWVGDVYAQKIAEEAFPKTKVKLLDNPYFVEIKILLDKTELKEKAVNKQKVLFVCENKSEHMFLQHGNANYLGYTELDSLKFFLDNIKKVHKDIDTIIIRPHPSEKNPKEKYGWAKKHPVKTFCSIQLSKEKDLMQDIVDCDIIVGAETMAMVIGLIAEKRVVSSIPKEGRKCLLPFSKIEHMLELF
jgi:hypothetical protein